MSGELETQVILNAIIVAVIQHLKTSKWFPWLSAETAKLNRIIAVLASGASSIGVHTTFDHTTGVLTITGLTLATISTGLYDWLKSFVIQQTLFRMTVKKPFDYTLGISGMPLPRESEVKGQAVITPIVK